MEPCHCGAAVRADQLAGVIFDTTFQAASCSSQYIYTLLNNGQYANGMLLLNPNSIAGVPGSFLQRNPGSLLVRTNILLLSSVSDCWPFEKRRPPC